MVDLSFKDFNFKWHFTYRNIDGSKKTRTQHDDEYRKLVFKHISKLSHLNEIELKGENGWGVLYEMFGKVGSPAQLIYGDSTHIVMASFYFLEAVNQDSLKPLIDYVKKDLRYMTESLKWKNPE